MKEKWWANCNKAEEVQKLPSLSKFKKAISQMNSDWASGKDSVPAEEYKTAGPGAIDAFHSILLHIWEKRGCLRISVKH